MSRYYSYINSATAIISTYDGSVPLSVWMKLFFSKEKKFGSKDRKTIAHLCYTYFRVGHALDHLETSERILTSLWLCSTDPDPVLAAIRPDWNAKADLPFSEKMASLGGSDFLVNIFPYRDELSEGIEQIPFASSFLIQPDLFLRLRPGKADKVKKAFTEAGVHFSEESAHCLRLPNNTSVEKIIETDRDAIVQDLNSQAVISLLTKQHFSNFPKAWDCCAGSGGKSILLADTYPGIKLTVSDKRKSILVNLRNRFAAAGINANKIFETDLTVESPVTADMFDLVVCDAPCTGSGTWARTPEQLYFFDKASIPRFETLQQSILQHIIPQLKPGGLLLYITCSVFRQENEAQADYIQKKFQLQLVKMELLKGYQQKADTMFTALFRKL